MNITLDELEAKIQQLYDDGELLDRRAVFDIGVEFGALLQKQNIQEYEYVFWNKLNENYDKEKLIKEAVTSIEDFLLKLIKLSINDYVKKNTCWSISRGKCSSHYDLFDASTLRKYCVQITHMNMTKYGGDFECRFKVVGRLSKIFKKHNILEHFDVSIYNENREERMGVYDIDQIDSSLNILNCHVRKIKNWELEQYRDFLHVVSKDFLFEIIKEA